MDGKVKRKKGVGRGGGGGGRCVDKHCHPISDCVQKQKLERGETGCKDRTWGSSRGCDLLRLSQVI